MKRPSFLLSMLCFGYAFLYAPIVLLVLYSFNDSKLVTVWGGFTTKWYGELLRDEQILDAAFLSLRIAGFSATIATILGTLGALVLVRHGAFRGRGLFTMLTAAPLVMPDVMIGLALLLLFVASQNLLGFPQARGFSTISLAHMTLAMAYVVVVVRARLGQLDPSLEEAAQDLGARPVRVFFSITLPLIAPALAAGWLLSFTLSLDDLVIANFVTGSGASTLPIVVWSKVRLGVSPEINALSTLLIGAVLIGVLVATRVMVRRSR